jgi:Tol biopolymer transport system component
VGVSRTVLLTSAAVVLASLACIAALLVIASVSPKRAEAAFPGSNGAIAYVSERSVSDWEVSYVYRVNPDRSGVRELAEAGAYRPTSVAPSWSSDGKKIAFMKYYNGDADPDNLADIIVMNANGTGKKNLTRNVPGYHAEPAFSPDGRWIAFASTRDGDWEIWKMRTDGTRATQLTKNTHTSDTSPDWQPLP